MACFCLHDHYLNRLSGVYFVMLHTKYNGVGPCGFRQYFFHICCKKLYKIKGHNLSKLGKVALGDAITL